jgi:putative DNA primase/helicase
MITYDDNKSLDEINLWADFWNYKKGINIFPLDKDKITHEKWSQYQTKAIPDEIHEEWKRTGRYAKGIILMPGKVWRGENKGLYFVGIDFDKELGINEFCNIIGTNMSSIDELKQKFIVEQHNKDPYSLHLYFYSEIPFTDKSPDTVLGIEIKSNCKGLMCATPSYHSETDSLWQIKGTDSPIILNSEEASKLMANINDICKKYNVLYLTNEKGDPSSSVYLTPLIKQMINSLEINPDITIKEGERHDTLLAIANSLLIKHKYNNNVNTEQLKNFFYGINNKLCVPEPLPESEIESIWRDAIKFSEEKTAGIQLVSKDENDIQHYNTPIVIQLEKGNKLIDEDVVQDFVYDIQTNSISYDLNHVYDRKNVIVPINIKKWDDARKTLQKLCEEKRIKKEHILLLLEALDNNHDLIKKHYLEYHRKNVAAKAAAEERRKQRLELIEEGTQFVMGKYRFLTIEESKEILFYDDSKGVYVYGGEIVIEKELDKKYGYNLKTADITEVKNYVTRKTYTKKERFDFNPDIINLKNGLYDWRTGEFLPHNPDYYSLNQKNILYNPKARSKYFIKFLKEVLHKEDILTGIDIVAFTFWRDNPHEHYFILIGTGANGKSVYTGLITSLHGLKNISNVSLNSLVTNRFALASLENKDVNIDTELSSTTIKDISILKKLTGKQPITIEKKGIDQYDTILHAKQIFNANQMPNIPDNSDARYRREIILSFPFQFEGEREDPDLLKKLSSEEEKSGIFNIISIALKRITKNGGRICINQKTIKERREKAELIHDPIKAFTNKAIAKDSVESDNEIKEILYLAYKRFCKYHKLPVEQKETLGKMLKKKPYEWKDGRKSKGDRETFWKGIKLKDKWKSDDIFIQPTIDGTSYGSDDNEEGEDEE